MKLNIKSLLPLILIFGVSLQSNLGAAASHGLAKGLAEKLIIALLELGYTSKALKLINGSSPDELNTVVDEIDMTPDEILEVGATPLVYAINRESPELEIINTLIVRGARVDACDNEGETPLHIAACRLNKSIIEILLRHGAGVNVRNNNGETPLACAVLACAVFLSMRGPGFIESIKLLIAAGADVNIPDDKGRTPLYYACRTKNIALINMLYAT